jgi:hypothetical protein
MVVTVTVQGKTLKECLAQLDEALRDGPEPHANPKEELSLASSSANADEEKPKRGRPPKPKPVDSAASRAPGNGGGEVSRDDVIAALQAYSDAHGGQVAARRVMKEVAGVDRLADAELKFYPALVAALNGGA